MNKRDKKQIKTKMKNVSDNSGFTTEELSLLSNTFYDHDEILMAIRKFLLQGELNDQETSILKTLTNDTIDVVKKQILPELDTNAPFHRARDLWTTINTSEKLAEDVYLDIKAQKIAIDYLSQRFECMDTVTENLTHIQLKNLIYDGAKDKDTAFTELKARNTLVTHVDVFLEALRVLAITSAEIDEDEKIKRLELDSNK